MAEQRGGQGEGAPSEGQSHRWAIDRIEEGTAAVEQDGDHVYEIPRYLVPADARDGDLLTVTTAESRPGEVTVTVRIDKTANAAMSAKRATGRPRPSKGRGGDIVL